MWKETQGKFGEGAEDTETGVYYLPEHAIFSDDLLEGCTRIQNKDRAEGEAPPHTHRRRLEIKRRTFEKLESKSCLRLQACNTPGTRRYAVAFVVLN